MSDGAVVIVGGTSGIGLRLAETYADRGREVVITGRDRERTASAAAGIGAASCTVDLAEPESIGSCLGEIGPVDRLIVGAVDRDENTIADYDVAAARKLVTMKLVGYAEVVHTLVPRLTPQASILFFGGLALKRPYPGSTTVTTVNGGVTSMVRTLVIELAPRRVNAIHPAIVGDSPQWIDMPDERRQALVSRTPIGRLVTMAEVVGACRFLLQNQAINGINLSVDGGWMCM